MRLESIVLGTALADPATIDEISRLRMSDFSGMHRDLFTIITDLHNEEALSYRSVVERLRGQGKLILLGDENHAGEGYLQHLMGLADSRGIKSYINQIEEEGARKNLREVAALIAADAVNSDKSIQELMDEAEKRILNVRRRTKNDEGVSFGELVDSYLPYLEGMRTGEIGPAWVPPLKAVGDLVQYVSRTEFVILAGRPGEGKSSLLRYDALKTALGDDTRRPQKVVTINCENDPHEYVKFAISTLTGINSAKLKNPRLLSDEEHEEVLRAGGFLRQIPWDIVTLPRPKAIDIDRIARKKVSEGAQLIQIDYLQLIDNGKHNRVEDLADTTGILRGIALNNNVPVVAACQLSRDIERRGELAEPRLSDLRESGSIEQDATQVWFIRSLWNNPPSPQEINGQEFHFQENFFDPSGVMLKSIVQAIPVKIWVKKNRNGPIGATQPIKWVKATGRFASLA